MASEIPVKSNNEVICNDVQITTGVEEVGVADHASNANISPNGFHLVALLSVQLRVLNDSARISCCLLLTLKTGVGSPESFVVW
uniref:Uncharacterized protein n=1 Tax=Trichuris muris TaxID=70415 RepID=A0A5S6Q3R5_TRIMR